MKYYQQEDGEWVRPLRGYRVGCCDCGLVHRINFRIRDGRVEFQAFRDERATAAKRRGQSRGQRGRRADRLREGKAP